MLRDLPLKEVYNSEDDNILEDFYIPALKSAVTYDRSVGYFDAKVLTTAARGLASFVANGGYMRLIVGATLTEEEYQAISAGYGEREVLERMSSNFDQALDEFTDPLFKNQLNTLTWFVQHKKLDIKIALRRGGIHHEKIGIIKDASGDGIVFQGSANETNRALSPFNYESINVFKNWLPAFKGHIDPHITKFDDLWNNRKKNTKVLEFTEIASGLLSRKVGAPFTPDLSKEIELWQEFIETSDPEDDLPRGPQIPIKLYGQNFALKAHQKQALKAWQENSFRGIFELATGAGKTITAIYGAIKVYESRKRLVLVISVPYQSLADQWAENLRVFNINPVICYGGEPRWREATQRKLMDFKLGLISFVALVVVDATLGSRSGKLAELLGELGEKDEQHFMFVGDECHHHGAKATYNALPLNAKLRLGLSATPDRGEPEGNDNLLQYYGPVVATYNLADALRDEVLTPYDYHLVQVSLTDQETEEYVALSKRISQAIAQAKGSKDPTSATNALNILFSKRARLINGCENKPIELRKLLAGIVPIKQSLFYCAEGSAEWSSSSEDEVDGLKQIEIISSLLHSLNWKSSQFTANEDKPRRESILQSFKAGEIDSLVAMKCLDEGIDVPACSTAFIMASSRQPRQFIQRRGRILRRSPGKTKAVIYDFFVTLPVSNADDGGIERRLLVAELKRIDEFASLSLNKASAYRILEPFLLKHDLTHHLS
jgi:superfamily II DNA or RNA helicase